MIKEFREGVIMMHQQVRLAHIFTSLSLITLLVNIFCNYSPII